MILSFIGGGFVDDAVRSESGLPIRAVYDADALAGFDPGAELGEPGAFPFTRGVYPSMYTGRPWTMRQYAGFGTAKESNQRYHELVANGTGGLSVAFDLPTQMGYDSDEPVARGEVGKVGVAIDSVEDMRVLFEGLPLDKISTSMTINAPAATLLLLYQLVAEEQGIAGGKLTGTIQNDVLKEYIARGTYIYPPRQSLRLISDIFAYCQREIPRWNTISISGYHMAEAGATPAQEVAFTLANAKEYVRAAIAAGLDVDDFGPRLSFFFVARTTILEEIAKFRAARRIWAHVMRDEFGAEEPQVADAAVPHPDRRGAADRAAAGGQPGPGHRAGPRRRPRRHPVAAHQLLRRGHRAADGEGGPAGAADPAGACRRDGRDQDRRPVRRVLRDRVHDRGPGGRRARADPGGRGPGRRRRRDRAGLPEGRDRGVRLPRRPGRSTTATRTVVGRQQVRQPAETSLTSRCASTRRSRPTSASASPCCAPSGTTGPSPARWTRSAPPPREPTTCCLPCARRCELRATGGEVAHALRDVWGVYRPRDSF